MTKRFPLHAIVACALVAAAALSGCDNTVDPFVGSENEAFAIYGYLDSEADTQFVRISPVIDAAGFAYTDTLGAVVELTGAPGDERILMQDSSIALEDGRRAYVYYAAFAPTPGTTYLLNVYRPGGDTTSAVARLPDSQNVNFLSVREGPAGNIEQPIIWDAGRVRDIEVHYKLDFNGEIETVSLAYNPPPTDESQTTTLHLEHDRNAIAARLGREFDIRDAYLSNVGVSAEILSTEWRRVDVSRIFFGTIGRVERQWSLPDSTVAALGYRLP